jgi:hypothetical protein
MSAPLTLPLDEMLEMTLIDIEMGISLLHEPGTDPEAWLESAQQRLREYITSARGAEAVKP